MTTLQDLESSLIGFVNERFLNTFPGVPLVWGNMPFDYGNPPDVYVLARVSLDATEGLAVNSQLDRHYGNIILTAVTKSGLGTLVANTAMQWLYETYRHATIDGIEVRNAKMAGAGPATGGYETHAFIPFVTPPL